ncbi:hypothetical protein KTR9_5425 (plasmid) [Gordonia sp. KTR9]|nr:hypothetical protein KTR9_5425 [Gordonia sp. KTR9]
MPVSAPLGEWPHAAAERGEARGNEPATVARVNGGPTRGYSAQLADLFGELGDRLSPEEELVGAQVTHGLDVERRLELFGVAVADALQRRDRRIGQLGQRLVFVCLVELVRNSSHDHSLRVLDDRVRNTREGAATAA